MSSRSNSAPTLLLATTGSVPVSTNIKSATVCVTKCSNDESATNRFSDYGKTLSQWFISCTTLDDGGCSLPDFGKVFDEETIWEIDSNPSNNEDPRNLGATTLSTKSQEQTPSCTKEVHMLAGWKHLVTSNNYC